MATTSTLDSSYLEEPINSDLSHVPGDLGLPVVGKTFPLLDDYYGLVDEMYKKYGPVFKMGQIGMDTVTCVGAEANKQILLDSKKVFSNLKGYEPSLGEFYEGGLLLQDFADHKAQRRMFQTAFKFDTMQSYTELLNNIVRENLAKWDKIEDFRFFPNVKEMLLDIGAQLFLGIADFKGDEAKKISNIFIEITEGMVGLVRVDSPALPFTKWRKGKVAMRNMQSYLIGKIEERREGDGTDMFSIICREKDEDGNYFSDEMIAKHINFLLFGAHDTTTSNLCYTMQMLAENREFLERARKQSQELGKPQLDFEDLKGMTELDNIQNETLRMYPPVMMYSRRTVTDVEICGVKVPANTIINLPPQYVHFMPEFWDNPEKFDPDRFSPERAEHKRHSHSFVPFGGGAHKCLGMNFAQMLVKSIMHQILLKYDWNVPAGYDPKQQTFPMPKQEDDLPLSLKAIA
ncbi:cytochrome P450 [Endozoicomonas sp. OPT23]|uniref:cytochrome P450 n=1 Tax=Endozoicomonas sp. OPT23 TaxID=2072845 RepID=UPI001891DFD4|nr:cytochrome P450 [Endozoicomonas sp. OPT23]